MKSVGVVIVCRYNSSRLPGKILKVIEGKTILERIYKRINQVFPTNKIIVATSIEETDDVIQEFCEENNIQLYRGSLENAAERFLKAGDKLGTDYIIRVNGDNLFIDLDLLKEVLGISESGDYDFITNVKGRTYPFGMSIESLHRENYQNIYFQHINTTNYKEHITLVLYESPHLIKSYYIYNTKELRAKGINLAIDTKQDFENAQKLIKEIELSGIDYSLSNLIDLYFNIRDE
ncbi:hypothetical protein N9C59_05370 [Flavobacteriales bacterium]|nr:hypothetical protein [Flavobacteriales bacterium]